MIPPPIPVNPEDLDPLNFDYERFWPYAEALINPNNSMLCSEDYMVRRLGWILLKQDTEGDLPDVPPSIYQSLKLILDTYADLGLYCRRTLGTELYYGMNLYRF